MKLYKEEFDTDYHPSQSIVDTIESLGFEDNSWHNNVCPSWTLGVDKETDYLGGYELFINAINEDLRECCGSCRFTLLKFDDNLNSSYEVQTVLETEDFDAMVAFIKTMGDK